MRPTIGLASLVLAACTSGSGDNVRRTPPPELLAAPSVTLEPSVPIDGVPWGRAGATLTVALDVEASQGLDLDATTLTFTGVRLEAQGDGVWSRVLDGTEGEGLKDLDVVLVDDIGQQVRVALDDAEDSDVGLVTVGFDFTPPQADCVVSPGTSNGTQDVTFRVAATEALAAAPDVTPNDEAITLGEVEQADRQYAWPVQFPENADFDPFSFTVTATDRVGNPQVGDSLCPAEDREGVRIGSGPALDGEPVVTGTPSVDDDGTPLVRAGAVVTVTIPLVADSPDVLPADSTVTLSGLDLTHDSTTDTATVWTTTLTGDEGDGLKSLDARLFDAAGNSVRVQRDDVVRFDFTAPTATCVISPKDANGSDTVTLEVRVSEALPTAPVPAPSDPALTVGPATTVGNVHTYALSVDNDDVAYVLTIPATDTAGNDADLSGTNTLCVEAERTGSIRAIGPTLTGEPVVTAEPSVDVQNDGPPWVKADAEVRVTFPTSEDVDPARSTVTLSGTALSWNAVNGWWDVVLDGSEGDGPKDLQANLADAAGNPLPVVRDDVVRFDFTPPVADCVITPDQANGEQDIRFDMFPSEALADDVTVTSDDVTVTRDMDASGWRWDLDGPDDADTTYVLDVQVTDEVGNTASGDALCPQADRTGQINAVLPTASAVTLSVSGNNTFDAEDPLVGDQAVVTVDITTTSDLDKAATVVQVGEIRLQHATGTSWTRTVTTADNDGRKPLSVALVDTTGNRAPGDSQGQAVVVDLTAPQATCTLSPALANATQDVTFALSPTEPLDGTPSITSSTVTMGTPGLSGDRWVSTVDAPAEADTTYVVHVAVSDRVGNSASGAAVCAEADRTGRVQAVIPSLNTPPVLTVSPSTYTDGTRPWAKGGDTVTVVLDPVGDLDTQATLVTLSGLELTHQSGSTWSVLLDGTEGDGLKDLRVELRDDAGNTDTVRLDDAVRFDFTPPSASCVLTPAEANADHEVQVALQPSEPLDGPPSLSSPDVTVQTPPTPDGTRWTADIIGPTDADTMYTLDAVLTDRVGNIASGHDVCPRADRTGRIAADIPNLSGDILLTVSPSVPDDDGTPSATADALLTVTLPTDDTIDPDASFVSLSGLALESADGITWSTTLDGSEGEGRKSLFATLVDVDGNALEVDRPHVAFIADFTPPDVASATLARDPFFAPADPGDGVVRFTDVDAFTGETIAAEWTIVASEPLGTDPVPTDTGPVPLPWSGGVRRGDRLDRGTWTLTSMVGLPEGTWPLSVTLADRVGNEATIAVGVSLAIDRTAPIEGPDVGTPGLIEVERAPWGPSTSDENATLSVQGAPGAAPPDRAVLVRVVSGRLLSTTTAADGSFGPLSAPLDDPAAAIAILDSAGNASAFQTIRQGSWTARFGSKTSGNPFPNPHRMFETPRGSAWRSGGSEVASYPRGPATGDVVRTPGQATWAEAPLPSPQPSPRTVRGVVLDPVRGRVVMFGGVDGSFRDETWEWDGHGWSEIARVTRPSARNGQAMAFDPNRQEVLLFGGVNGGPLSDTWSWDGTRWAHLDVGGPPGRWRSHLALDRDRATLVLFGGYDGTSMLDDTWTWDGTSWTEHTPVSSPSARGRHAVATDPETGRATLFGGDDEVTEFSDTWIWTGSTWLDVTPVAGSPPGRLNASMVPDTSQDRLLMFGGERAGAVRDDLWAWDGESWSAVSSTTAGPAARNTHGMAIDPMTHAPMVFGGRTDTEARLGDTWVFADGAWVDVTPSADSPTARRDHAMAWDPVRERIVLFGGSQTVGGRQQDTWTWDGRTWHEVVELETRPSPRSGHTMAWSDADDAVLLFGGADEAGQKRSDTWTWNGEAWSLRTPAGGVPPPRRRHGMAMDPAGDGVVLFGGYEDLDPFDDLWRWDGAAWSEIPADPPWPDSRRVNAFLYNPGSGSSLMYGGDDGTLEFGDTWSWDGEAWTLRTASSAPGARTRHGIAWDPDLDQLVLFGGNDGIRRNDTWRWDDTSWQPVPVASAPSARARHAMVTDRARGQIVLFGGFDDRRVGDTWTFDAALDRRARQRIEVDWSAADVLDADLRSVTFTFTSGAVGLPGGVETEGATLSVWDMDRWRTVATHEAGADDPATLCWTVRASGEEPESCPSVTTDPELLRRLFVGAERVQLHVAVEPNAPNGTGIPGDPTRQYGEIRTSDVSVTVRYSLPPDD